MVEHTYAHVGERMRARVYVYVRVVVVVVRRGQVGREAQAPVPMNLYGSVSLCHCISVSVCGPGHGV